jgi:hypothetical protein
VVATASKLVCSGSNKIKDFGLQGTCFKRVGEQPLLELELVATARGRVQLAGDVVD